MLRHEKNHRLPLAGAANGSEICIKDASGNLALFAITTKPTTVPEVGFLLGDMTV